MGQVRYFVTATGRVQGVGFRMFVQQNAKELGIVGWVRNMADGSVAMEIQGIQDAVDVLEKRIRKGNYFIKVEALHFEPREAMESLSFEIRY